MLTDEDLTALLADLESDRVERKQSVSKADRIGEAICAVANDLPNHRKPGVVFVGVKDDGSCAGLEITDKLLRALSETREMVLPFPTIYVVKRRLNGCDIAAVIVELSDARLFVSISEFGFAWAREEPLQRKKRSGACPKRDVAQSDFRSAPGFQRHDCRFGPRSLQPHLPSSKRCPGSPRRKPADS